jgi:signal transduction histidine kinase
MARLFDRLERSSRSSLVLAGLVVLALIGIVDYLTGYEMFFSVFYLLEVSLAAWYVGRGVGLIMSVLSVVVWIGGDLAAGARYSSELVPIWNAVILMAFYFIVVWLLTSLRSLHRDLETRVRQRTEALTHEMAERERLEAEILQISEREQRRIGHDLHDSLCQHLTATALAGQVLTERLTSKALSEADDASKVVELVEEGITLARSLAHGLYPVEMEAEGLMDAFQELAANITSRSKVRCVFERASPVLLHDAAAATHLYRIAQEAVTNAVRHGKAKRIVISLTERGGTITLTVEDDGIGLPDTRQESKGLGIRIMAHRAVMMGGTLLVEPAPTGGTIVSCSLPKEPQPTKGMHGHSGAA